LALGVDETDFVLVRRAVLPLSVAMKKYPLVAKCESPVLAT